MRTHISLRKPTVGRLINLGAKIAYEITIGGKPIWVISYGNVKLNQIITKFRRQLRTDAEINGVGCWNAVTEEWETLPTEKERNEIPF